jgi:hypothetical protein
MIRADGLHAPANACGVADRTTAKAKTAAAIARIARAKPMPSVINQ